MSAALYRYTSAVANTEQAQARVDDLQAKLVSIERDKSCATAQHQAIQSRLNETILKLQNETQALSNDFEHEIQELNIDVSQCPSHAAQLSAVYHTRMEDLKSQLQITQKQLTEFQAASIDATHSDQIQSLAEGMLHLEQTQRMQLHAIRDVVQEITADLREVHNETAKENAAFQKQSKELKALEKSKSECKANMTTTMSEASRLQAELNASTALVQELRSTHAKTESRIEILTESLSREKMNNSSLQSELADCQRENKSNNQKLGEETIKISRLKAEIQTQLSRHRALESTLQPLQERLQAQSQQLVEKEAALAQMTEEHSILQRELLCTKQIVAHLEQINAQLQDPLDDLRTLLQEQTGRTLEADALVQSLQREKESQRLAMINMEAQQEHLTRDLQQVQDERTALETRLVDCETRVHELQTMTQTEQLNQSGVQAALADAEAQAFRLESQLSIWIAKNHVLEQTLHKHKDAKWFAFMSRHPRLGQSRHPITRRRTNSSQRAIRRIAYNVTNEKADPMDVDQHGGAMRSS